MLTHLPRPRRGRGQGEGAVVVLLMCVFVLSPAAAHAQSLDEVVEHTCVRVLDLFGLAESAAAASTLTVRRWPGLDPSARA